MIRNVSTSTVWYFLPPFTPTDGWSLANVITSTIPIINHSFRTRAIKPIAHQTDALSKPTSTEICPVLLFRTQLLYRNDWRQRAVLSDPKYLPLQRA